MPSLVAINTSNSPNTRLRGLVSAEDVAPPPGVLNTHRYQQQQRRQQLQAIPAPSICKIGAGGPHKRATVGA